MDMMVRIGMRQRKAETPQPLYLLLEVPYPIFARHFQSVYLSVENPVFAKERVALNTLGQRDPCGKHDMDPDFVDKTFFDS